MALDAEPDASGHGSAGNPLADYFYIAGIESTSIFDERNLSGAVPVETTIDENAALVTDAPNSPRPTTPASPIISTGEFPKRRSKRFSFDARKSLTGAVGTQDTPGVTSNRSSAVTIKGLQTAAILSEEDFEQALRKFATERDSFLDGIHSPTDAPGPDHQRSMRARPKTIRITGHEEHTSAGIRANVGSLRRRLSTMNNLRKSGTPGRQSSTRTSKRLSTYNSVIPAPEPFKMDPTMHPLKRRYEPVLLDRYPTQDMVEDSKRRCPFPDYVPMFAFPNDVSVVSSDERPASTWHGFTMTNGDGSRLHSICVIMWTPLAADASAELERQCEAWRRANMSAEERELANSLGERLAAERAKLSRLLSQLPATASESEEREELEDEISAVEERISLMADLLRPVRHAAASKIEGLTQNETGFWIPRVYGLLGRDAGLTSFYKEWLKAVIVPMTDGGVLNVPATSPRVGMWQPLERYVINLCVEAPSPISSLVQVEVAIRELRLYARKEAINELPGSRNTDLYALFRTLSVPTIVSLFECAISESRIILTSRHTSMLHLACQALVSLLYPLTWTGIFIPVLPHRLIQALEAPCPYIIGVEKKHDNIELPSDDFVLIDLDEDHMEGTAPPRSLPRQIRRKLTALLYAAAPHHNRYGVPTGPPQYATETFPHNLYSTESPAIYSAHTTKSGLAMHVATSSNSFSDSNIGRGEMPIFNAFLHAKAEGSRTPQTARPTTSSTHKGSHSSSNFAPPSPTISSPMSGFFPATPASRNDSAFGLQTALREKRSGNLDTSARRSSSFGFDRVNPLRRPSAPFNAGHSSSMSQSSISISNGPGYAPSVYAASTLAASTVMPAMLVQHVKDTDTTKWVEGHCMLKRSRPSPVTCVICNEKCADESFDCSGCSIQAHAVCVPRIAIVCPQAFRPDLVRAAFVRCWASLLYTYRRHMLNANGARRKAGLLYHFDVNAFMKGLPADTADYWSMLRETQAFNEFVHERETKRSDDPAVKLFDDIIMSKRNRGRTRIFSRTETSFLSDTSDHLWRTAAASIPSSRFPGDYRQIVSRVPAQLDPSLMKEPRSNQGAPRIPKARTTRKPIPSMLGINLDTTVDGLRGLEISGAGVEGDGSTGDPGSAGTAGDLDASRGGALAAGTATGNGEYGAVDDARSEGKV